MYTSFQQFWLIEVFQKVSKINVTLKKRFIIQRDYCYNKL